MLRIEGRAEINEHLLGLVPSEVFSRVLKNIALRTIEDDPDWLLVELENPEDKEIVFNALSGLGYNVEKRPHSTLRIDA